MFNLVLEIILGKKKKKSLWKSDLWLQDADEHGKFALNADIIKLCNSGCVDISVQ